jgi:glycosyltransferase involved in cell wall biosynthesis
MKIAIVTDAWHPQVSGVVTTLDVTARTLSRTGHEILVIHPGMFRTVACPTYPQIRLALAPGKKLAGSLDAFGPDRIHAATEGPLGLACRSYCRKRGRAFTTSFTTRFDQYVSLRFPLPSAWVLSYLRWFHSASSRVMVSTPSLQGELLERGFSRIALWERGVDTRTFRPRPEPLLQVPRPVHLYVGRVAVEKSVEDFLRLPLPGSKYVVGDGPDLERLRRAYPDVAFSGTRTGEELAEYYAAADVFVFPSRTDTYGIVMLEAMASGVPVAAYPVRGPADLIVQGLTGFLDEDLGRATERALSLSRDLCRAYALNYSWERSVRQFLDNLVPAASGASPAARSP